MTLTPLANPRVAQAGPLPPAITEFDAARIASWPTLVSQAISRVGATRRPPMGEIFVKRAWGIGPVACCAVGLAGLYCWPFLAGAVFRAAARAVGQAGAPAAVAPVRARARTNELDAGTRWPRIGGEERSACGCGLPGGCGVRRSGSHIHPFGARPGRGHDRAIRAGLLSQFVERGWAGSGCSSSSPGAWRPLRPVTCAVFPAWARWRVAVPRPRRR